jgi:hypothetical protein
MKRALVYVAIALVTLIILTMLFDMEPMPARPLGPTETPHKLTPAEQRDLQTHGRRKGNG